VVLPSTTLRRLLHSHAICQNKVQTSPATADCLLDVQAKLQCHACLRGLVRKRAVQRHPVLKIDIARLALSSRRNLSEHISKTFWGLIDPRMIMPVYVTYQDRHRARQSVRPTRSRRHRFDVRTAVQVRSREHPQRIASVARVDRRICGRAQSLKTRRPSTTPRNSCVCWQGLSHQVFDCELTEGGPAVANRQLTCRPFLIPGRAWVLVPSVHPATH
jgi:hypothetical protein